MIEAVVGLLMFVSGDLKEARIQKIWLYVYAISAKLKDNTAKM